MVLRGSKVLPGLTVLKEPKASKASTGRRDRKATPVAVARSIPGPWEACSSPW